MSGNPSRIEVAIIQRVVPDYRIPVFNAISDLDGVALTVIHGTNPLDRPRGNGDFESNEIRFDRRELPTTAFQPFGLHLVWLRDLLNSVRTDEFDVYICPASPSILPVVIIPFLTRDGPEVIWWGRSLGAKREVSAIGNAVRVLAEYVRGPLYRSGACCVCYGTAAAEFFQSYGVPPEATYIAYNSTDTKTMDAIREQYENDGNTLQELRERYDANGRDVLFFVGTHTKEKNIDDLVDVHARLLAQDYEASLIIAGTGPETEQLQEYAADIPHIHFTGRISDEELAKHLLLTDVFVMPGHGGLAVQQAMTMAVPVVTTPLDGTERDLVDVGENGYIVPSNDIRALTNRVRDVLDKPDAEREAMGQRSREIVDERINLNRMVEGFRRAIEKATDTNLPTIDTDDRA